MPIMRRDLSIILQLGFGFLLVFAAFNSQGFIEIAVLRSLADQSTGITANSGYYSMSIIYFVFTLCNLIAPPVIARIGPKWSMVFGAGCYTIFLLGFLHLSAWLLYSLSALLGLGAAYYATLCTVIMGMGYYYRIYVIWTGNGVYLVRFSREGKMARNSAIMWTMLQTSLVAGAIFLAFVLHTGDLVSSFHFVYTVFAAVCAAGILVLVTLPGSPTDIIYEEDREDLIENEERREVEIPATRQSPPAVVLSFGEEFVRTFALLKTQNMLTLIVVFLFSGIETSFYTGVFTACLSAFKSLSSVHKAIIAYAVLAMGGGQIVGGLWFGLGAKDTSKFGRSGVVLFGMSLHIVAYFLCFLNLPMTAPLGNTGPGEVGYIEPSFIAALITAFMLGLADSAWHTQLYTMLGGIYKDTDSSAAFALFKFFQSLASCAAFYYGSVLLLHWQLLFLVVMAAAGAVCFFTVHNAAAKEENFLRNED